MPTNSPSGSTEYDYIVVGAGAAGCVIARRLADAGARILLLEAGGADNDWRISLPFAWPDLLRRRRQHWIYESRVDDQKAGELLAGKVLGGSSSVNALAFVRGHKTDYDGWEAQGLKGYGFADLLRYFRRMERWEDGASALRGGDGPISVARTHLLDPLTEAFLSGAEAAGHALNDDYNGAEQDGFGLVQATIQQGRRCSAFDGYIRQKSPSKSIAVETEARATRIDIGAGRAKGVHYIQRGRVKYARAMREIILSGGAIQSPALLMLSGIGDPEVLRAHAISVQAPLASVGRNLQNHLSLAVRFQRKQVGTIRRSLRYDRLAIELARARFFRDGLFSILPTCAIGFVRTDSGLTAPNLQISCTAVADDARPYLPFAVPNTPDGFSVRAMVLRPSASGALKLVDSDPLKGPVVQQGRNTPADDQTLAQALTAIGSIASRPSMANLIDDPAASNIPKEGDARLAYIRRNTSYLHHPCGTCRMGAAEDPDAAVMPDFSVKGIEALRVVDASVMPSLVGGNIYACVTMLAEKASDEILAEFRPGCRLSNGA